MAELVGVHGMAKQQLGRHLLQKAWGPALADGLERAAGHTVSEPALQIAFYGDLFLPAVPPTGLKSGSTDDFDETTEDEWQEITEALAQSVTEQEIAAAAEQPDKGYTRTPLAVQALLRAVDRRFGAAASVLTIGVLRQVRRYLTVAEDKAAIAARVEAAVGPDCRVLIAHSLGSVVAYEYLRDHPGHPVELFLTVGSPLGLRMVRDRLDVGELAVPRWVNVRDVRDLVACSGPLSTWWPQIGATGERIVDNGGDTHAVERYLSRKQTGAVLAAALPHLVAG